MPVWLTAGRHASSDSVVLMGLKINKPGPTHCFFNAEFVGYQHRVALFLADPHFMIPIRESAPSSLSLIVISDVQHTSLHTKNSACVICNADNGSLSDFGCTCWCRNTIFCSSANIKFKYHTQAQLAVNTFRGCPWHECRVWSSGNF